MDEQEVQNEESGGNVVDPKYREKYGSDGHNGDDIAVYLKSVCADEKGKIDIEYMKELGAANGIDMSEYAHLNPGMQRMCLGNRLRGLHNRGDDVTIGDRTVKGSKEGKEKAAAKAKAAEEKEAAKAAKAEEAKKKSSKKKAA